MTNEEKIVAPGDFGCVIGLDGLSLYKFPR